MKGLVIFPGDAVYVEEFSSVEQARDKYINGWLEGLWLHGAYAYIDEDGKMKGLPRNRVATTLVNVDRPGFENRDFISGNMVVFGPIGPDGEHDSDCPEALISIARLHGDWREW